MIQVFFFFFSPLTFQESQGTVLQLHDHSLHTAHHGSDVEQSQYERLERDTDKGVSMLTGCV